MNHVEEQRADHDRHRRQDARSNRCGRAETSKQMGRRIEPQREEQAASDRHRIEPHVTNLADSPRHEPLKPFIEHGHHDRGQYGNRQQRRLLPLAAGAEEQQRQQAVLDEMDPLDEIDVGIAAGVLSKTGAWFNYGDTRLGQGRENARDFLKANSEIAIKIEDEIRNKVASIDVGVEGISEAE